jgi:hypothetical protein
VLRGAGGGYRKIVGQQGSIIRCVECGTESDELAVGWRAHLARDLDQGENEQEVVLFCPDCARREFGTFEAGLSG